MRGPFTVPGEVLVRPRRVSPRPSRPAEGEALDRLYIRIEHFAAVLQEKYGLSRTEALRKIAALKRAFHEE